MHLEQFFVEGLGCASYLIGSEEQGLAAVIDADRDVQQYITAAEARGMKITHIIETHLHADHVSGNMDLRQRTAADIYLHAQAGVEFKHNQLADGDTFELGEIQMKVRHTPGHTPDSLTLLVSDISRSGDAWLALTGDTLFVGDIGRPDLVGEEEARGLAEQMHHSLFQVLLKLDDGVLVLPGHGAGSLCGKAIDSMRSSTIGYERRFNPSLAARSLPEFVEYAITNLPKQPGNHRYIKDLNTSGPRTLGDLQPAGLTIKQSLPYFQNGAALLDLRPREEFIEQHVPGSVNLQPDDQLSNLIGFILSPEMPLILLGSNGLDYSVVALSVARVGYENIVGYLTEGLDAWGQMNLPLTSGDISSIDVTELRDMLDTASDDGLLLLDVREPWEYARGHVPGAQLIPLDQLSAHLDQLDPETPVATICESGVRSQSAAAVLGQEGFKKIYNVAGGTHAWAQAGYPLEQ